MSSNTLALGGTGNLDEHHRQSRQAQWQADKWMMSGALLLGTAVFGIFGLPLFLRGLWLQIRAERSGLTMRPVIVTLIGYLARGLIWPDYQ